MMLELNKPYPKWRNAIITKLRVERAISLSDSEIERVLGPCVAGIELVKLAKRYRDKGILTEQDILQRKLF